MARHGVTEPVVLDTCHEGFPLSRSHLTFAFRGVSKPMVVRQSSSCRSFSEHSSSELQEILQNPAYGATSTATTYLGVSPPSRTGNPLAHDASWKTCAYSASHTNLQALRELDSAGVSFLRCGAARGDTRLLLGSPDLEPGALSEAASTSSSDSDSQGCSVAPARAQREAFSCSVSYFPAV